MLAVGRAWPCGLRYGDAAEKLAAFILGVGVGVEVAFDDGLGIAGLQRGVADTAVQGAVIRNE